MSNILSAAFDEIMGRATFVISIIFFAMVAIFLAACYRLNLVEAELKRTRPAYDCTVVLPKTTPDCPAAIKNLVQKNSELEAQLNMIATETAAAKLRADARETAQLTQQQRDQDALKAAPRDASGNIICDANCLRARFKN